MRAVWKQEVLWAEAPVADVALACEEHYHFVLDVSGNRELMEGHTKAGQFVQVNALVDSICSWRSGGVLEKRNPAIVLFSSP